MPSASGVRIKEFTSREVLPVKNTFINFDEPAAARVLRCHVRSASCPAWVWPYRCVDGAPTWEGATQALCQAMALKPMADDIVFYTPDSSPTSSNADVAICDPITKEIQYEFQASCSTLSSVEPPHQSDSDETLIECGTIDPGEIVQSNTSTSKAEDSDASNEWIEVRASKRKSKIQRVPPSKSCMCHSLQKLCRCDSKLAPCSPPPAISPQSERAFKSRAPAQQVMHVHPGKMCKTKCRAITQKFDVGIDVDRGFNVLRRLFGTAGANIKRIVAESMGAKVWVCCGDSCVSDSGDWVESMGPLMICVSAMSGPSFDIAVQQVNELLETVRREHNEFRRDGPAKRVAKGSSHQNRVSKNGRPQKILLARLV